MPDAKQNMPTASFDAHPLPMAIFGPDRRLKRLNQSARRICEVEEDFEQTWTPAELLAFVASTHDVDGIASAQDNAVPALCEMDNGDFHLLLTEQRDAAVPRSDERARTMLRDAIESLEEGFSLWDDDFNFLMCNDKYMQVVARHRDTPIPVGESADTLLRAGYRSGVFEIPDEVDEDTYVESYLAWARSHVGPIEAKTKDGATIIVSSKKTDLGGVLITARDVTEERNADQKALEMLYDIVESLEEGAALWDDEMRFVMCNQKYRDFVFHNLPDKSPEPGTPGVEVIGTLYDTQTYDLPDDVTREAFVTNWLEWVEKFGEPTELALTDGRNMVVNCKRSSLGGYLITVEDNTAQRRLEAELEAQREAAHQNEKLSALGELLAGVAHELNNPLSIVVGYSQMLLGQLPDPKQNQKIAKINQAADRSARIVKTFLAMARQRPGSVESCDLSEIIEVAIDVAGYSLRTSGGTIDLDRSENLPRVAVDRDQMAQVFSNLIVNAEHAMRGIEEEPRLSISIEHDKKRSAVVTRVSDNGKGMSGEVQKRIFDPFFTTKDVGEGTGFGLAFCHRIVATHQGQLTVSSAQGKGSVFTLSLPVAKTPRSALAPQSPRARLELARGNREAILVVDDEVDVANLIAETLTSHGFDATTAAGPQAALDTLKTRQFDAIISDVKMPGMRGDELMKTIIEAEPRYRGRVGFVTGDSLTKTVETFLSQGRVPFIEKPIITHEIVSLAASLSQPDRSRP